VGFEPTDNGFANRPLWPLGYAAMPPFAVYDSRQGGVNNFKILLILLPIGIFYNKHPRYLGFFCNIFTLVNVYISIKSGGFGAPFSA
jgi:hypothetical protein